MDHLPWLRTAVLSVKDVPTVGALSVAVGVSTTRSGAGAAPTVTVTAVEQLFSVYLTRRAPSPRRRRSSTSPVWAARSR